jgi:hypothetical protein
MAKRTWVVANTRLTSVTGQLIVNNASPGAIRETQAVTNNKPSRTSFSLFLAWLSLPRAKRDGTDTRQNHDEWQRPDESKRAVVASDD